MDIANGRFVITGGASLIGSHVADALLADGAREVILLDNFSLGTPQAVAHLEDDDRVRLVRGDILRVGELFDAFEGADGVFAIAGFLTLPLTQNPPLGLAVNVNGMVNVFEACRFAGVKKVVFSSSLAAIGEPGPEPITEESHSNLAAFQAGTKLYACSKLIGEALCQLYGAKHGVDGVALRYATVYGERQHYRGVNALYIIDNYERIARGERPRITGDGSEVHDYVHVADVARANVMAMASDVAGEVFNIGSGVSTDLNRLVDLIVKITGTDLEPEYVEAKGAVKSTSSSTIDFRIEKARDMLGWEPQVDIEAGLRRLIEWRKTQP
ncbi:MAG: NAD-dependent epimerase/dehydratase family protein [Novosphingobium sp.]|nr:NAD-dependent epimerase/dehydratase family protein [Novosphingobium sp.]